MSVAPDQMPGLPGMNQPADPNLQQFEDLQGKAAGVEEAAATNTAQTASAMQSMQPPQRQTGIFSQAPYLIGLAALGGKAIGLNSRVMLGAMNGMVKGMLMGNQQAYDDAVNQYKENRQKLLDTWNLQQKYYETLYHAYGDRADAKLKAWEASEKLANNEFDKQLAIKAAQLNQDKFAFDRQLRTKEYLEKVRNDNLLEQDRKFKEDLAKQKSDQHSKEVEAKLGTLKGPDGIKQIDSQIRTLNTQASALRQKSITGYEGLSDQDKQQYDQILNDMARLNVRKQELTEQGTQQSASPTGSPGEPQGGNVVTSAQLQKYASDNGIDVGTARKILEGRGANIQDQSQQPQDTSNPRAGVIDREAPLGP